MSEEMKNIKIGKYGEIIRGNALQGTEAIGNMRAVRLPVGENMDSDSKYSVSSLKMKVIRELQLLEDVEITAPVAKEEEVVEIAPAVEEPVPEPTQVVEGVPVEPAPIQEMPAEEPKFIIDQEVEAPAVEIPVVETPVAEVEVETPVASVEEVDPSGLNLGLIKNQVGIHREELKNTRQNQETGMEVDFLQYKNIVEKNKESFNDAAALADRSLDALEKACEQFTEKIAEKDAVINEKDQTIEQNKQTYEDALEAQKEKHDKEMLTKNEQHDAELAASNKARHEELVDAKQKHDEELAEKDRQHAEEIENLQTDFDNSLKEEVRRHETEAKDMKEKYDRSIGNLEQQVNHMRKLVDQVMGGVQKIDEREEQVDIAVENVAKEKESLNELKQDLNAESEHVADIPDEPEGGLAFVALGEEPVVTRGRSKNRGKGQK